MISDIDAFVIDELVEQYRREPDTRDDSLRSLASLVKNHTVLTHLKVEACDPSSPRRENLRAILEALHIELPREDAPRAAEPQRSPPCEIEAESLSRLLASKEPHTVKIEALRRVIEARNHHCWPVIRDRIVEEDDDWVLATLLRAAGTLGDQYALPVLTPFLRSPDPRIVANAIEALEQVDPDQLTRLLLPMLLHGERRVRAASTVVLGRRRREELMGRLSALARDPNRGNRLRALESLSFLEGDDVDRLLVTMLETERDMSVLKGVAELAARQITESSMPLLVSRTRSCHGARHSVLAYVTTALASRYGLSIAELSPKTAPAEPRVEEPSAPPSRRSLPDPEAIDLPHAATADDLDGLRSRPGAVDLSSSRTVHSFNELRQRSPSSPAAPPLRRPFSVPWAAVLPLAIVALLFALKSGLAPSPFPGAPVTKEAADSSFDRLREEALHRMKRRPSAESKSTSLSGEGRMVELRGTLRGVAEHRLTLRADGVIYSVRLPAGIQTASLKRGDPVSLRGRCRHWGYSGLVYVDGESLQPERKSP